MTMSYLINANSLLKNEINKKSIRNCREKNCNKVIEVTQVLITKTTIEMFIIKKEQ